MRPFYRQVALPEIKKQGHTRRTAVLRFSKNVFRLRGVEIHRVIRCEAVGQELEAAAPPAGEPDALRPLEEFVRRLGLCADYEELTRAALYALEG
jgi:hypothetical protein